jgi:hypothetical protein
MEPKLRARHIQVANAAKATLGKYGVSLDSTVSAVIIYNISFRT